MNISNEAVQLYLPKCAGWYDLYSGKWYAGGQKIIADAPYERMPVFVKAGSIIPFGPSLQYTSEKPADTITLNIYTGADASFNLYEDEGTNYNYEKGKYTIIPMIYNDQAKTLTIDKRKGGFDGMLNGRTLIAVIRRLPRLGPPRDPGLPDLADGEGRLTGPDELVGHQQVVVLEQCGHAAPLSTMFICEPTPQQCVGSVFTCR